jgi:FlaG/FlaF family flagellin (archaellin)
MKAVSAVLAVILVVIIVVALVGLTYTFSVALFGVTAGAGETMTETGVTGLMAQARIEFMSINDVIIKNIGLTDISNFTVLINGEQSDFTIDTPVIEPEKLGIIKILDFLKEGDEITILSSEGATITKKAPDPCDGAVLCLSLDEGSGNTVEDTSGHTDNDGVFYTGSFIDGIIYDAERVSGKFGKALKFNRSGIVNVTIPDDDSLDFNTNDSFTIEMWVKTDIHDTSNNIYYTFRRYPGGAIRISTRFGYFYVGDYNSLRDSIGTYTRFGGGGHLQVGVWYHVAVVRDVTADQVFFYVNGNLEDSKTDNTCPTCHYISSNNSFIGPGWNGTIDEVRIYGRALSQEEIQVDMQSSVPITTPIGSWSFEESGTIANNTRYWIKGKYGSALSFDGIDDYVNIPYKPALQPDSITLEALIKAHSLPQYEGIITNKGGSNDGINLQIGTKKNISALVGNGSAFVYVSTSWAPQIDVWYHIAVTHDATTSSNKLYVNGNLENETIFDLSYTDQPTRIGQFYIDLLPFNGTIDEVRIYDKVIY